MTERLRDALAALDGVVENESAFQDGPAYWVNGKEIAHFEGPATLATPPPTGSDLARRRRFH